MAGAPSSQDARQRGVGRTLVWKCSCGWSVEEAGDLKGFAAAGNHRKQARAQGEEDEHEIIGLVDQETGEVVQGASGPIAGLNFRRAALLFGKAPKAQEKPAGGAQRGRHQADGEAGARPAGRQARVLVRDLDLTDNVELLFRLDRQFFPSAFDPAGDTDPKVRAEEMALWIEDMVILAHTLHPRLRVVYKALHDRMQEFAGEAV